jgi:hypothetical protein
VSGFFRWVRSTSEHYLMIDAQDKVAKRLGTPRPSAPRGAAIFWRRVYVPMFYVLPAALRDRIIASMPGSHRNQWPVEPELKGPAV